MDFLFLYFTKLFLMKLERSLALNTQFVHWKEPKIQISYWESTVARDVYNALLFLNGTDADPD